MQLKPKEARLVGDFSPRPAGHPNSFHFTVTENRAKQQTWNECEASTKQTLVKLTERGRSRASRCELSVRPQVLWCWSQIRSQWSRIHLHLHRPLDFNFQSRNNSSINKLLFFKVPKNQGLIYFLLFVHLVGRHLNASPLCSVTLGCAFCTTFIHF